MTESGYLVLYVLAASLKHKGEHEGRAGEIHSTERRAITMRRLLGQGVFSMSPIYGKVKGRVI